jgi:hypothetical protein
VNRDSVVRGAHDRLLADLAEFLARYAWTAQHDESLALYERIKTAREYIAVEDAQATAQGKGRPA